MYFPNNSSLILECNYSKEKVISTLKDVMELEATENHLFEKDKIFNHPLYGNMAQIECTIESNNDKSLLSIKFQIHTIFIISTILFTIFGISGAIFTILKNDINQLMGFLPLCLVTPLEIMVFYFDKNNKLEKIKKTFHIK